MVNASNVQNMLQEVDITSSKIFLGKGKIFQHFTSLESFATMGSL
jgi:hypothetical protein